ncbi:MAG: hypothetical protein Q8P18_32785 [Pseudomonadota bacterium]|nr:hypothetical protein [Pseudomonadota bacterium]
MLSRITGFRVLHLLLLTACIDYEFGKDPAQPALDTADTSDSPPDDETDIGPSDESCNGVDDDGDGLVDEEYGDVDGDGAADCVDDACVSEVPSPRSEVSDACGGSVDAGVPPANPWNVEILWQYLGSGVASTPAIGDLDGDRIPEVVFNNDAAGGSTVVLDGVTGRRKWSVTGMDPYSGPALGDIDGDGFGDVVTSSGSCFGEHVVSAYDRDGVLMWRTPIGNACETYANLTDLDGDGDVEVIVNEYVLDGATGAVLFTLDITGTNWGAPAVADMDNDGTQEILLETDVFDAAGNLLWSCGTGGNGTFPQPVNVDADDEGELLVAGANRMTLCDDDGTVLWSRNYSSYGTAVCVADFDNDGVQEFGFAQSGNFYLIESDGSNRWVTPVNDSSGLAGCTSWDVDYDGVPEVVFADERDIMVLDGATGAVVVRDPNHGSPTAAETPAVADVDGDGHGDLVYGSMSSDYTGITVITGAEGDWPYARPVYNQYTYYGENVGDDLSIPAYAEAPWRVDANLFRGQPSAVFLQAQPNLRVDIADVCFASCDADGRVEVQVQVWNDGVADVADAMVALYGLPGGAETLLEARATGPIASGASVELLFVTTADEVGDGLHVVVDRDGALDECDEGDNEDTWADAPCP